MTGQDAVSWNVIAAPEFSLEPRRWCFVVAGCVPYRGYFDPEAAERFLRQAQRQVNSRFYLYQQLAHLAIRHAEENPDNKA